MDISHEINKHLEWIESVVSLLGKEEITKQEVNAVSQHDRCALGQWLSSEEAMEFKGLPELEELIESHEAFHNLAGELITAAEAGKDIEAMEAQEKFIEMSKKVIGLLLVLKKKSDENSSGGSTQ